MKYVLTSHAHKLSSLSIMYNVAGDVCKVGAKDILQLLHDPMNLSETSNLHHSLCGNISDSLLTTVACSYEFGGNAFFCWIECHRKTIIVLFLLFSWK